MQDQQPRSTSTFDYVVVGTGAAGLHRRRPPVGRPRHHRLRAGVRSARPAPVHSHSGGLHQDHVQRSLHLAVQDRAVAERQRALGHHPGRPHRRRIELDQRHDHQPRPGRRFQQLGAARQRGLGLRRPAALLQAVRAPDRRRRRPLSRPRRQHPGDRPRLAARDLRGVPRRRRRPRHSPQRATTTARRSPASAICSAASTRGCAAARAACICCRRRRSPGGSTFAPMRAPSRSCSRARRRWRSAMSTSAAGPSTRCRPARR